MNVTHVLSNAYLLNESDYDDLPPGTPVPINRGRWTKRERRVFEEGFRKYGKEWKLIAGLIKTRTVIQIRTHAQKYFQKLAKQTGGPVLSTSKKEKMPPGWQPKEGEIVQNNISATSPSEILSNASMTTPRKRKRSFDCEPRFISAPKPPMAASENYKSNGVITRKGRELRVYSLDTLTGSASERGSVADDEADLTDDEINKELEFYNIKGAESSPKKGASSSGRVTPSMLAAATVLLAPRLTNKISPKRLTWARNFLSKY